MALFMSNPFMEEPAFQMNRAFVSKRQSKSALVYDKISQRITQEQMKALTSLNTGDVENMENTSMSEAEKIYHLLM